MAKLTRKPAPAPTHLGADGAVRMVDVSAKEQQVRTATAVGSITLNQAARKACELGSAKGSVFAVATIAAVGAAKRTAELIPLCHALPLDGVDVAFELGPQELRCRARVTTCARTGVEMEALAAVSVGLLTVYDMCKAVDKQMRIGEIKLVAKRKEPRP